jgi:CheY-like chemotaxis protein
VIEPQIQAFYVQPMLNKIEREFSQQADSKDLAYRSRESALAVRSDPSLIELILRNLVSNAIKYTRHGGLLVNFRRKGAMGVFEVWDTGIGIAASQQESIFREFHQLGNPERDRNKGLGLGLAIVQGLAHSLGIRLSLNSVVGRGSVFRLELPLSINETPQAANFVAHREHVLPNVRVLVLDDDPIICAGMVQLLRGWGCVCEAAQSIEMAIAVAANLQPDVVISDYRLRAHRTGIEAVRALRNVMGVALPALLITGDTAPERLREAMTSGIPVLHKPVSSSQLFHALISVLPDDKTT